MFAGNIRVAGLKLLGRHRVREGMVACVRGIRGQKKHASEHRAPEVLEVLKGYGAHAQACIPELERVADHFVNDEEGFPENPSQQKAHNVRDAIEAIRAARKRPPLVDLR